MNLEDLCAYIMQPEMKKTKKKGKKKQQQKGVETTIEEGTRGESAEERSTSVDETQMASNATESNQDIPKGGGTTRDTGARSASTAPAKTNNMFVARGQVTSTKGDSQSGNSSVADSAAAGLPEEAALAQNFSDEQFESAMAAFSQRLETYCNEKVANHAQRMKPNYDGQWIVNLKLKLKKLDVQED